MREFNDRQSERFALILKTASPNNRLAIFVHGFEGSYLQTWGDLATILRGERDAVFNRWDYAFFGYDTPTAPTLLSVSRRLADLCKKALEGKAPFKHKYDEISFFGHSLGTLVIRQLLCARSDQPTGFDAAIRRITLFGSPVNGSWLARFGRGMGLKHILSNPSALLPWRYQIAHWLLPDGALLETLRAWHSSLWPLKLIPQVRLCQGTRDMVVGYGAINAQWDGDDRAEIDTSHLQIVNARANDWPSSFLRDEILAALS